MNKILSPAERSALKARAHPLRPVVMIGTDGLSAAVLQEIDNSLKAHELIKIRVDSDDQDERDDLMGTICANTGASAIQHIGKILVVFRERQDKHKAKGEGGAGKGRKRAGGGQDAMRGAPRTGAGGGNRNGAKSGGAKSGGGKGGQVWTKVRAQKPRRNKPRKPAEG